MGKFTRKLEKIKGLSEEKGSDIKKSKTGSKKTPEQEVALITNAIKVGKDKIDSKEAAVARLQQSIAKTKEHINELESVLVEKEIELEGKRAS